MIKTLSNEFMQKISTDEALPRYHGRERLEPRGID